LRLFSNLIPIIFISFKIISHDMIALANINIKLFLKPRY
jgi:hypothetical protein